MQSKTKFSKTLDNHFYFQIFQVFLYLVSSSVIIASSPFLYEKNNFLAGNVWLLIAMLNFIFCLIVIFSNNFYNALNCQKENINLQYKQMIDLLDRYVAGDEEEGRIDNNLYQEAKKILGKTKT